MKVIDLAETSLDIVIMFAERSRSPTAAISASPVVIAPVVWIVAVSLAFKRIVPSSKAAADEIATSPLVPELD